MFYIKFAANESGSHGNPVSNQSEGMVALPEELIPAYLEYRGFVNLEVVNGVVTSVTVDQESFDAYTQGNPIESNLDRTRRRKLRSIRKRCGEVIVAGVDVTFSNGDTEHFNLSVEDQSNIANLFRVVELGGTEFPYQADGGSCRVYTKDEIVQIYIAAQSYITTQTTYHNALKEFVQTLDDEAKIKAVEYGMELPEPYASQMQAKLSSAQAQINAILERLGN